MHIQELKSRVISILEEHYLPSSLSYGCEFLEKAESILHAYLKQHPHDIEALFMLALVVRAVPLADELQAIEVLKKIVSLDPQNYKALLALAYIQNLVGRGISEETLARLEQFKTNDNSIASMIEIARAIYFSHLDDEKREYEDILKKSIKLRGKYAWNYIYLGRILAMRGLIEEGNNYIQQGLNNVIFPQEPYTAESLIDIDRFINEYITGTEMSETNYRLIKGC